MDPVHPLRISKTSPGSSSSPSKMPVPRPLSEIGSTERRRNSPSYNQATRKMIVSSEASPYTDNSSFLSDKSPRQFWSGKNTLSPSTFDTENIPERAPSPSNISPTRRASIEKLMQAGRVKSSNIFALENKDAYDPASVPVVERPSANRPLSVQLANNTFARYDSLRKENNPLRSPQRNSHKRSDTELIAPSVTSTPSKILLPPSPTKEPSPSPTKSSLSRNSQFGQLYNLDHSSLSDIEDRAATPRSLHRHNKSVTFHEDPPIINEYEEQTPEPSISVISGSREGSWESDEYDERDFSFEREVSSDRHHDDSFDDDLENTAKTPVVMPEDWSRISPDTARTDLVDPEDDVFDEPSPVQRRMLSRSDSVASDGSSRPLPPLPGSMIMRRGSSASRGLPSPPKRASCTKDEIRRMTSNSSLSAHERLQMRASNTGERPNSSQCDKSDSSQDTAEELMVTNLDTGEKHGFQVEVTEVMTEDESMLADLADFANPAPRISRESILRKVRSSRYESDDDEDIDTSDIDSGTSPIRPSIEQLARMHPDEPIPSRENSRETSDYDLKNEMLGVHIKEEPVDDEDEIDMSAIPTIDQRAASSRSPSRMCERESSVIRHHVTYDDNEEDEEQYSRYSSVDPEVESTVLHNVVRESTEETEDGKETLNDAMQLLSVKDYSEKTPRPESGDLMGLPSYLSADDYDFGMKKYITPSPPPSNEPTEVLKPAVVEAGPQPVAEVKNTMRDLPRPTYDGSEFSPPSTPDSALYHEFSEYSCFDEQSAFYDESFTHESTEIPERRATIKTGGRLKARPSASRADIQMMAEQRRLVSAEHPVPDIPQAYQAEFEMATDHDIEPSQVSNDSEKTKADSLVDQSNEDSSKLKLDFSIPDLQTASNGEGFDLEREFDRVIEAQKVRYLQFIFDTYSISGDGQAAYHAHNGVSTTNPSDVEPETSLPSPFTPHQSGDIAIANSYSRSQKGYLTRQNTKVVVASNRNFSNESNETAKSSETASSAHTLESKPKSGLKEPKSPKKMPAEQVLKTEPWNGKVRRKSQRVASLAKLSMPTGPAPPLPGQSSALDAVDESFAVGSSSLEEDVGEGVERGRLFVKVVGIKNLDLPLPRNDRIYFQLTLDNGLHCVTTANLELGRNALIGQEFELVVLNDLEFQLTLTTRLPPPPAVIAPTVVPSKASKQSKAGGISRFLASPKKRAEKERQEREAAEAEERRLREEAQRKRASMQPTAWDLLHELVSNADGSFARAYVNLNAHEKQCFGRQLRVEVPCYNEWALEKDASVVNSVRSKRGSTHTGPIRRPPYIVGNLELQLLYVPKPKDAGDDEMPKSMNSAIREMGKAGEFKEVLHEGYLSQQGGDCVHWRRRFFRLQGPKLTAYHEHTNQKRAVINLSKASRLVDDRRTLIADPTSGHPASRKGRRKSAFAEEDEGYQYVEEGFRIRFANGETIDFYADSRAAKDDWMVALSEVIGKPDPGKKAATWTDLVLARERANGTASASATAASSMLSTTDVRDFTKPPAANAAAAATTTAVAGEVIVRKPAVPAKDPPRPGSSKSPSKAAAVVPKRAAPQAPPTAEPSRPSTPPMSPRRGHRSRDAVKSMIF